MLIDEDRIAIGVHGDECSFRTRVRGFPSELHPAMRDQFGALHTSRRIPELKKVK
jgi:hypothetical protein